MGGYSLPRGGASDYLIIKIDSVGTKQWGRSYGGLYSDILYSLERTQDGGYILGGSSVSGIGKDKSETSRGFNDYWIVKVDQKGRKQWDKTFGTWRPD